MLGQLIFRFLIGGAIVSGFALAGDLFTRKSFAGLFGGAPSVALATLALTITHDGKLYAATEARSMIGGALAFFVYASCVSRIMMRYKLSALFVTTALLPLWLGIALGFLLVFLRHA